MAWPAPKASNQTEAGSGTMVPETWTSMPKVTAVRTFLDRFHDETLAALRPPCAEQKSFIQPPSAGQ